MGRRGALGSFWVLDDTSTYTERGADRLNGSRGRAPIAIRLYKVMRRTPELVDEVRYTPREAGSRDYKGRLVLALLRRARVRKGSVVVAGSRFANGANFLRDLADLKLDFVVALPPEAAESHSLRGLTPRQTLFERLAHAVWRKSRIRAPNSSATYSIAELDRISVVGMRGLRCVALSTGRITNYRRGVVLGVSSLSAKVPIDRIARLLGWTRWARSVSRSTKKKQLAATGLVAVSRDSTRDPAEQLVTDLSARASRKIANKQDRQVMLEKMPGLFDASDARRGRLSPGKARLNVVELFAGAGGLSLGFLMAREASRGYRLLFSGEIEPVFTNTLRINVEFLRQHHCVEVDDVPEDTPSVDLRTSSVMDRVQAIARQYNGVDIVVGGPPCQGFSSANRNSWSSRNPNNKLVETYLDYVVRLRPRAFIMENVQGILWTPRHDGGQVSVAEHVATRLAAAGYRIFPKLLDAAWYGVPQHRNRFFLFGLHTDLGYAQDDFGEWGPFPRPTHGPMASRPYVTVGEGIGDLPPIENGAALEHLPYEAPRPANGFLSEMRRWAPPDVIWDHVTSRHAEYVIDRYRRIPAGGNWSQIADMMTNYASVERTHSNIYRRLLWAEPAITIGQYRKAMLVHPEQHRGLSLREASRLQSFPDWFRFAGSEQHREGGLSYKQQQLGNAVCPLVARSVAEFFLGL